MATAPLSVADIVAQVTLIQEVMHKVMTEGEHYGAIPGCGNKKVLLQPGAQKLTMTFRLAPEYEIQETDLARGHKEYRVVCTLKSISSGTFVGQGVGCCSTMEAKYRWRSGEGESTGKAVPKAYWEARDQSLLGGSGFQARKIDGQWTICEKGEKVENDNPADCYNTVLKIAKKRAYVDATITATAASDIFTQDIGDPETADTGRPADEAAKPANAAQPAKPAKTAPSANSRPARAIVAPTPPPTQPKAPPAKVPPAQATEKTRAWAITELCKQVDPTDLHEYAAFEGWIMPNEDLTDWNLTAVPTSKEGLEAIRKDIKTWIDGGEPPKEQAATDAPWDAPHAPWRSFPTPFGKNAGVALAKLAKNTLFGFWANFQVETEYQGKPRPPAKIESDKVFRAVLDDAGRHYKFTVPEEKENK